MTINQHGALSVNSRVVDQFEAMDLGTPFKVILHQAVRVTYDQKTGEAVSYSIPDLDGLLRTIVISRILEPRKLSGAEIKFIRRSLGVKQKDMAQRIEMSTEHLSRCEIGSLVMSPTSEKLLRIFALKTAMKLNKYKCCDAKTKLEDALDRLFDMMKPVSVFSANDELELHFHRTNPSCTNDNSDDGDASHADGEWNSDPYPAEAA